MTRLEILTWCRTTNFICFIQAVNSSITFHWIVQTSAIVTSELIPYITCCLNIIVYKNIRKQPNFRFSNIKLLHYLKFNKITNLWFILKPTRLRTSDFISLIKAVCPSITSQRLVNTSATVASKLIPYIALLCRWTNIWLKTRELLHLKIWVY